MKDKITEGKVEKATSKALNYLSYKARTVYEMRGYLEKKGFCDGVIEEAIKKLGEMKYLDDYNYAVEWLEIQLAAGDKGPKLMEYKLRQKGISPGIAAEAIDKLIDGNMEFEMATSLFLKKYGQNPNLNYTEKQKAGAFLSRKGFSYEVVVKVLDLESGPF